MSSTLIVRDALRVVHGDPSVAADPELHLELRVAEARSFDRALVESCLAALGPAAGSDTSEPEVLEAVLILALAQPQVAEDMGLVAVVQGRHLAVRLEADGEVDSACHVLRLLTEHLPANRAIERSLAALMRRQGMVQDLVERYLARARALLDEGRKQEAIPWLREVLQLDRSRKDVGRMIRDLRFDEVDERRTRKWRVRAAVLVACASLLFSLVALREVQVRQTFAALPRTAGDDLSSLRTRLASLEAFIEEHAIWHGALGVLEERSELRVEIDRLNTAILTRREAHARDARRREGQADGARDKARRLADAHDFGGALIEFRRALELAATDWPQRARTGRDVAAIEQYLREEEGE